MVVSGGEGPGWGVKCGGSTSNRRAIGLLISADPWASCVLVGVALHIGHTIQSCPCKGMAQVIQ
jgi:hypothetical protein